jgi:hemolysin activation/secretion protein
MKIVSPKKMMAGIVSGIVLAGGAAGVFLPVAEGANDKGFGNNDPGVQLNRTREYLERERIARQITEDRNKKKTTVESKAEDSKPVGQKELSFAITEIRVTPSKILSNAEIKQITDAFVGEKVTVSELYGMVHKINKLYISKGYATCRAFLPAQTIVKGIVFVNLVEGKTGKVSVEGNKSTKAAYIMHRLSLQKNRIDNINELNDSILRFNGTNDVQLRVKMQAGSEEGTTDYLVTAYEPQKETWSIYTDNAGNYSNGDWRYGLFYTNRSLTGERDTLTIGTLDSQGLRSFSAGYIRQLGRSGTRLETSYNTNSVHIVNGNLANFDMGGHAYALSFKLAQPLKVSEKIRTEASLEYVKQSSKTSVLGSPWLDDSGYDTVLSYAMTNYGDSSVLYQKHGYTFGDNKDIAAEKKNYSRYQLTSMYQKLYKHGQMFNIRFDAQLGLNHYMPSSRQFYIGGAYSVRGYKESILSGDHGYALGVEYAVPVFNKQTNAFCFWDYGAVYGDSSFDDHILTSVGLGIKSTIDKNYFASLTLGFPLRKEINGTDVNRGRLNFVFSGQF